MQTQFPHRVAISTCKIVGGVVIDCDLLQNCRGFAACFVPMATQWLSQTSWIIIRDAAYTHPQPNKFLFAMDLESLVDLLNALLWAACHLHLILCTWDAVTTCISPTVFFLHGVRWGSWKFCSDVPASLSPALFLRFFFCLQFYYKNSGRKGRIRLLLVRWKCSMIKFVQFS